MILIYKIKPQNLILEEKFYYLKKMNNQIIKVILSLIFFCLHFFNKSLFNISYFYLYKIILYFFIPLKYINNFQMKFFYF